MKQNYKWEVQHERENNNKNVSVWIKRLTFDEKDGTYLYEGTYVYDKGSTNDYKVIHYSPI